MIRFKVGQTLVRVHVLAILMALLSLAMGARTQLAAMLPALTVHEAAHLLAARALHVRVEALDILPFGGALTMENPYRLARRQMLGVALAGPAGNLVGMFLSAALAWWRILPAEFALEMVRFCGMLAAFNLLPALPLDGGRALYALLDGRASHALTLLIFAGRALAGALCVAAAVGFARTGRVNLALVLSAVFLFAAGARERRGALLGAAEAVADRARWQDRDPERPQRMRVLAVDAQADALRVLGGLSPREEALLAVYRGGKLAALSDTRALERALLKAEGEPPRAPLTVGQILSPGA